MITLRTYLHEIENFVDQNLLDQVVAHSTHILKEYPNSYEAMRFLAQAYLEEKKFKESSSIFEKILTIVPDDFISHVGMSAIKEDQQDLDSAIFHMELAYDTQPSNVIVQDELKRLLQKRDGERPAKINLSRGSLIRMYIKGDLHQQALNEISAALSENPDRLDFLVLKALVYSNSNDKVRAAETCNQILEKFPYCLEANRILLELFTERDLKNQSSQVLDRLSTVNPYYRYVNKSFLKVEDVPDSKIELEKLDYTSAFSAGFQDIWSPPLKDIISQSLNNDSQDDASSTSDELPQETSANSQIPEFLASAGWEKSDNPNNEPPEPVDYSDSEILQEPQKNSELPEWLKNFQPSSNFIEDSPLSFPSNDEPVSIIDENVVNELVISNIEETPIESISSSSEVAMTTDNPENIAPKDDSSDWMSQFFEEANKSVTEPEEEKSLPDWLKTFDQEESISENSSDGEVPDWLKNLDSQIIPNSQEEKGNLTADSPSILEFRNSPSDEIDQQVDITEEKVVEENLQVSPDEFILPKETQEEPALSLDDVLSPTSTIASESISHGVSETQFEVESNETNETLLPDWVKSVLSSPEEESAPTDVGQNQFEEAEHIFEPSKNEPEESMFVAETPEHISEPIIEINEGAISKETGEELLQWLSEVSTDKTERPGLTIDDYSRSDNVPAGNIQPIEESILTSNDISERNTDIGQLTAEPTENSEFELEAQLSDQDQQEVNSTFDALSQSESEIASISEVSIDKEYLPNQEITADSMLVDEGNTPEISEIVDTENLEPVESTTLDEQVSEASLEQSISEKFELLVSNNNFQEAKSLFPSMNASGIDNEQIIEIITSGDESRFKEFEFMQFLGDTLAEFNHFEQAMEIYTKAESLLTGK